MVGHAGSTTGIVHADMTLTRSKVRVKVTGLLNFQKLAKPCMPAAMTIRPLAGLSGCLRVCFYFCLCRVTRSTIFFFLLIINNIVEVIR